MGNIMQQEIEPVVVRMRNAQRQFRQDVIDRIGCTQDEADRILGLYVRERIVRYQAGVGRYNVTHGVFLDVPVLQNALAMVGQEGVGS